MDIVRRNTDYAMRMMVLLGQGRDGELFSAREISDREGVSYTLTCKLLQKLSKAGLVESVMGTAGGFRLARSSDEISMLDIVGAVQGPVTLNRCMLGLDRCEKSGECPIREKLTGLQDYMADYLKGITLAELIETKGKMCEK